MRTVAHRLVSSLALALVLAACAAPGPAPTGTAGSSGPPPVTCEAAARDCAAETTAVLSAVANVGHPVTHITFGSDAMCIWYPFLEGVHSCPAIIIPDGTVHTTSAIVTFAGTNQQAFLNLFWLADGSFSPSMALVAPPAGVTPFP